jgi:hypothetical protein
MEYIVDNFSEEIYFPDVTWKDIEDCDKKAAKNYMIGMHYHKVFYQYYSGNWMPWQNDSKYTEDYILLCLGILYKTILKYLNDVKGKKLSFEEEAQNLRNDLRKLYDKKETKVSVDTELKFLLRRLENNIEIEITKSLLREVVKVKHLNKSQILDAINLCTVNKDKVVSMVNNIIPELEDIHE